MWISVANGEGSENGSRDQKYEKVCILFEENKLTMNLRYTDFKYTFTQK
jgi:hypothetical protein